MLVAAESGCFKIGLSYRVLERAAEVLVDLGDLQVDASFVVYFPNRRIAERVERLLHACLHEFRRVEHPLGEQRSGYTEWFNGAGLSRAREILLLQAGLFNCKPEPLPNRPPKPLPADNEESPAPLKYGEVHWKLPPGLVVPLSADRTLKEIQRFVVALGGRVVWIDETGSLVYQLSPEWEYVSGSRKPNHSLHLVWDASAADDGWLSFRAKAPDIEFTLVEVGALRFCRIGVNDEPNVRARWRWKRFMSRRHRGLVGWSKRYEPPVREFFERVRSGDHEFLAAIGARFLFLERHLLSGR